MDISSAVILQYGNLQDGFDWDVCIIAIYISYILSAYPSLVPMYRLFSQQQILSTYKTKGSLK